MMFYNFKEVIPQSQIGVKAHYFKELMDMNVLLPNSFVVTKDFLKRLLESNDIEDDFNSLLLRLKTNFDLKISENIKRLISNLTISVELSEQLNKEYLKLGYNSDEVNSAFDLVSKPVVVVRSSDENKKLDTFTNVKDKTELLKALKSCWQSYFNKETFSEQTTMALIVQLMIKTDKSGWVDYSDNLEIKSFWGQAGFIGKCQPDNILIDANITKIVSKQRGEQNKAFVLDKSSYVEKLIPESLRNHFVLDDKELNEIIGISKKLKQKFNQFSFEFGFAKKKLYILNIKVNNKEENIINIQDNDIQDNEQSIEVQNETHNSILDMYEPDVVKDVQDNSVKDAVTDTNNSNKVYENQNEFNDSNFDQILNTNDNNDVNKTSNEDNSTMIKMNPVESNLESYDIKIQPSDENNKQSDVAQKNNDVNEDSAIKIIDETIEKYITINPNLKDVFVLLKKELIDELK